MSNHTGRPGWVIREQGETFTPSLTEIIPGQLPDHDTLIQVHVSSLNYKDVLSWTGNKGITKNYPHTTGVDAAGVIVESADPALTPGDEVIVIGFDLGMNTPGGHGGWIRVPSEWVIPKPTGLTLIDCMTIGTAGFTAAQSLYRFQQLDLPTDAGDVIVTGATGGVGSVAVSLLSNAGYRVVAATRQTDQTDWLTSLGASEVILPAEVLNDSQRPMVKGRWAGGVDTVGGPLLESILRSTRQRGVVTCCGMIGGTTISTSIFPYILRGINLMGIDSAECPMPMKREIWSRLGSDWNPDQLKLLRTEIPLTELPASMDAMKSGGVNGRRVVMHDPA